MSILVIAEHNNIDLNKSTLNTITAAQKIGGEIHLLIAGHKCQALSGKASTIVGLHQVLLVDDENYQYHLAETMADLIVSMASEYSHILAPATTFGKNILPRVAALLDVAQVSDITGVEAENIFVRPIYAGNAIATVESLDDTKVITVRASAFDAARQDGSSVEIKQVEAPNTKVYSAFLSEALSQSDRPELSSADVVISGGRGLGSKENFESLEELAQKLNAAIGASRAAVDAGFAANDLQVGQTGKIVAPNLYIAIGISGAIQHLAGMKESKVIVAINKDEDAPIFSVSDYGLVMDLFEALQELKQKL